MSDPFTNDVLERLIRSNSDSQRAHRDYIVPLAERLLDSRASVADRDRTIATLRASEKQAVENLDALAVSYGELLRRAAALERRLAALTEFCEFIVTLDDARAYELRRSVTLTEIIERARAALAEQPADTTEQP